LLALVLPRRAPNKSAGVPAAVIPQRIIAIAPNTAEIVCELGATDRLVAVGRYCKHPPQITDLPRIGGLRDPDLETILALRPDLLMVRGHTAAVETLCRDNGIRVYHDPTERLADIERAVLEIGELLGLGDRAADVAARMRSELSSIRRSVEGLPRPRVLFTSRNPDQLAAIYSVAKGSYLDELISLAGGENIFGDQDTPYPLVGLEEILVRRPEVIIESLFGQGGSPGLRSAVVAQWRAIGPIPAVETGRLHILTADYATVPSPRVVRMAADLVKIIHPEIAGGPG
jgi:iron complex transport system substrate-binding protein